MLAEIFKGLFEGLAVASHGVAKGVDEVAEVSGAPPVVRATVGGISGALTLAGAAADKVSQTDFSSLGISPGSFSALWSPSQSNGPALPDAPSVKASAISEPMREHDIDVHHGLSVSAKVVTGGRGVF